MDEIAEGLDNYFPVYAALYVAYCLLAYAVLLGDDLLRSPILKNRFDLRRRQLCSSVSFALGLPSLIRLVHVVVLRCSKEQMRWPDTGGVITAMENAQAFGDLAFKKLPRCSVRHYAFPLSAECKLAVAATLFLPSALPIPAISGGINVAKEAFFNVFHTRDYTTRGV